MCCRVMCYFWTTIRCCDGHDHALLFSCCLRLCCLHSRCHNRCDSNNDAPESSPLRCLLVDPSNSQQKRRNKIITRQRVIGVLVSSFILTATYGANDML